MLELFRTAVAGWIKLSRRGRNALILFAICLLLVSMIDAVAIVLFSDIAQSNLQNILKTNPENLVLSFGFVLILFLIKSALSVTVTWFSFKRFSKEEVYLGSKNFKNYLRAPWIIQQNEPPSDLFVAVDKGPYIMTQQFLATIAALVSEFMNCLFIVGVLFLYSPGTATVISVFIITTAVMQHKVLSKKAAGLGQDIARLQQVTHDVLDDTFRLRKVLKIMPSLSLESHLLKIREKLAISRAHAQFLEALPRFVMESALVIGIALAAFITYAFMGADQVIGTLSTLGVAAFRVIPSLNRIQGLTLSLFGKTAQAKQAIPSDHRSIKPITKIFATTQQNSIASLRGVTFQYPAATQPALKNISIDFERGKCYAFVGPSGAGKSTLMEVMMGLLEPSSGSLTWFVQSDEIFAYVPQDNQVLTSSLHCNVSLEWDESQTNKKSATDALLASFLTIQNQDHLVNSAIQFDTISGGERQRLGIARALYRDAPILFLDEPTSSLDASTENEVMTAIKNLSGNRTIFIIAHRLSTVQNADCLLYLENGNLIGCGTFDSLRQEIPNFQDQIQLASITK